MSGYLNRAQIIGNLGSDPEVRMTQTGKKVVTLSVATSESWRDQRTGERTEWHRVVIFNEGLAGIAEQYLTKGAKILVEGKLATTKWKDREGNDRYTTEIQVQPYNGILTFLSSKKQDEGRASADAGETRRRPAVAGAGGADPDDHIPF